MRKITKYGFALVGIFFIIGGILFISLFAGANKRCTETVMATVVDYREDYDASDRTTSYFPIVEYIANRKHIEATSSTGSGKTPYEIGASVSIRYNPEDPEEFVFDGDKTSVKAGIYLIVVGVICVGLDVLSALGIIKGSTTTYRRNRYNRGRGISIDPVTISQTVDFAKTFKSVAKDLKNMTPEERKAYYEAVNNHPEQFVDIEESEEE